MSRRKTAKRRRKYTARDLDNAIRAMAAIGEHVGREHPAFNRAFKRMLTIKRAVEKNPRARKAVVPFANLGVPFSSLRLPPLPPGTI